MNPVATWIQYRTCMTSFGVRPSSLAMTSSPSINTCVVSLMSFSLNLHSHASGLEYDLEALCVANPTLISRQHNLQNLGCTGEHCKCDKLHVHGRDSKRNRTHSSDAHKQ